MSVKFTKQESCSEKDEFKSFVRQHNTKKDLFDFLFTCRNIAYVYKVYQCMEEIVCFSGF